MAEPMETPLDAASMKNYIPKPEFFFFLIAALGEDLVYGCMSGYITDYYMSVLRLSPVFVLLLMLLARVWNAFNDPLVGMIVDSHTTKWGRMRPYAAITAIPIAVLTVLMFRDPGVTGTGMYVYTACVYVLWGMLFTLGDVPFWSCSNVMTPNPDERGKLISLGMIFGGAGTGIATVLPLGIGLLLARTGGMDNTQLEQKKYLYTALIVSAVGMTLFSLSSFRIRERITLPNLTKKTTDGKSMLHRLFHCKPLMLVVMMGVLSSGRYMMQIAAVHVARYGFYMGPDPAGLSPEELQLAAQASISKIAILIQASVGIGVFGAMLALPFLYRKFHYKQLVIGSCLGGFAADILTCVIGWPTKNLFLCIPFMIVASIPLGVLNVVSYAMICDSLDYMEWETGFRDNALGSSCQSFVNKLGNALATGMIILTYMTAHLDIRQICSSGGDPVVLATDLTAGQNFAMFSLVTLVPGVSMLLCCIPIFFYDLVGEKKARITRELFQKRAARGIAVGK